MPTKSGFEQYIHTIRNAYFNGGVPLSPDCFPPATVCELAPDECMAACYPFLKKRTTGIISSVQSELFDKLRGGSVCLNSSWAFPKWFSASVRLPSGLMAAR